MRWMSMMATALTVAASASLFAADYEPLCRVSFEASAPNVMSAKGAFTFRYQPPSNVYGVSGPIVITYEGGSQSVINLSVGDVSQGRASFAAGLQGSALSIGVDLNENRVALVAHRGFGTLNVTQQSVECSSRPVSTGVWEKHGNNGTVSCKTFCEDPLRQWGNPGQCVGTRLPSVPCGQVIGLLKNGSPLSCSCQNASGAYSKNFNNGTVSCDTFCAGEIWGPVGQCAAGSHADNVPCDQVPGLLNNGAEMTCLCQS
jgi:hypothetical protein